MAITANPIKYGLRGSIQDKLDEIPPIPAIAAITGGMQQVEAAKAATIPVVAAVFPFPGVKFEEFFAWLIMLLLLQIDL
jgi:hypothetical protein